jgi:hypothetical protein
MGSTSQNLSSIVGGTVAKPAQPNVRSDAASQNEAATAVAGAGPGVPAWKAACKSLKGAAGSGDVLVSPSGRYMWNFDHWLELATPAETNIGFGDECNAHATCPPDWPTPAHADDPREEPERFDEATGPMAETVTRIDPIGGGYYRTITKPVDSIEKLIDRLAKVNGAIEVSHGMMFRVTGQVEKAEPRTHDEPGYPEHFALHHVYLPEDWTRDILASMSSDLTSKLDKGTLRTVLESAARALLLTGSLDEADLLGLAVAVEDKLDIGK